MSDDIIIDVKNVWKRYGLPPLLPWKRHALREEDCALKDISFQVRRGGSLGILGRNGAGKSTLLKLLAGVTPPDKGSIDIRGSIFPMIELNAGISMELSGRENIQLLATIMGFNDKAIRRLEPEVVDFSELEGWIDKPVWQYSSGMLARLGFSIAVNVKSDILLVDEVLTVGDIKFQRKAHEKMRSLISSGITFLYVTQNAYEVERICENGLILSHGLLSFYGSGTDAKINYIKENFKSNNNNSTLKITCVAPGNGDVTISHAEILNCNRENLNSINLFEDIILKLECTARIDLTEFKIAIRICDISGLLISSLSPCQDWYPSSIKAGKFSIFCKIKNFSLYGTEFILNIKLTNLNTAEIVSISEFPNTAIEPTYAETLGNQGMVFLKTEWSIKK